MGGAHQVDDVVQLEEVADLVAAVDEADQPRADLGRHGVDGVADDVVQQLVGVPRLAASLSSAARSRRRLFQDKALHLVSATDPTGSTPAPDT